MSCLVIPKQEKQDKIQKVVIQRIIMQLFQNKLSSFSVGRTHM